jgi:hypothetical protein
LIADRRPRGAKISHGRFRAADFPPGAMYSRI